MEEIDHKFLVALYLMKVKLVLSATEDSEYQRFLGQVSFQKS